MSKRNLLIYTSTIPDSKHRIIEHTTNGPIIYCYIMKMKAVGINTSGPTICKACNKTF